MRLTIEQGLPGAKAAAGRGDAVVIVDVIRASTTYTTALAAGAARIVPCESRAHLARTRERYPDALRAGERECRRIAGYDLGSSPSEMATADLEGRTLLSTTTNGSRMVVAAAGAPLILMGGLCNASAVAAYLRRADRDVSFVCSGRLDLPVIEDWLGAIYLAHLTDGQAAADFGLTPAQVRDACFRSPSYGALQRADLLPDFERCMDFDSLDVVPVLDGDGFVARRPE